jgi:hypothetical protein
VAVHIIYQNFLVAEKCPSAMLPFRSNIWIVAVYLDSLVLRPIFGILLPILHEDIFMDSLNGRDLSWNTGTDRTAGE